MDALFAGSMMKVLGGAVFTALLAWACVTDLRDRRIPNRLVLALGIGGLLFSLLGGISGIGTAVVGLVVGFLLWIPVYAIGALGAGDVKLFAAAAAWLGPVGALQGALLAALAGGVLAVGLELRRGTGRALLHSMSARLVTRQWRPEERATAVNTPGGLPYGVALATGALLAGWFPAILR